MSGEPPFDDQLDDSGDAPSEEETQAANALRQALEGRPGGTHLPEPALEAAALLRFSSDAGRLSQQRRAVLRADLMASLAAASGRAEKQREDKPGKGWRHWLGLGLTLAGGVTAVVVIGVIGARQLSEPAANQEARWADARSRPALAPAPQSTSSAAETAKAETATEDTASAPAEAAAPAAAPRAEPEAPARLVANSARDSAPAAKVAAAPSAAASGASKGQVAREASGAGAPGGGVGSLARRQDIVAQAAPEASRAEARDDESGAFGLGAAAGPRARAADQPAAEAAEAKKTQGTPPAVPTQQVRRASDQYRARLLADLADPRVDDAYAESERAQSKAELERAQGRLGALASSGLGTSADAERLRPDVYCRLAEIALRLGQPQAALDWARRGLALGAPASPFVARLYLLEGQAKSALGDREGAAKSYLKAIQVNEQLLDESLDGR